jgi:hypothetical protein
MFLRFGGLSRAALSGRFAMNLGSGQSDLFFCHSFFVFEIFVWDGLQKRSAVGKLWLLGDALCTRVSSGPPRWGLISK